MSIHDQVSVGRLFIGFSLILMYKFLTDSCEASLSFVEMERHAVLKGINEILPLFLYFSSIWLKLEQISINVLNYYEL